MINFGEQVSFIWSIAEILRGNYKQSEYGKIGRGVAAVQSEGMQEYVNLYVRSTRKFIESIASGSTFPSITSEDLGNIPFAIPTVAEQRQIAAFLDQEIPKIDTLRNKST